MPRTSQPLRSQHSAANGHPGGDLAEYLERLKVHPPGSIALTVGELGRYHAFTMAIVSVEYPPGTRIHMVQSLSIAANLNIVIRDMAPEAEWLWCQSDDHVFPPDALLRLLDRNVDVVAPIICRRRPPFSSLVFQEETEEGYMAYPWDALPTEGLFGPVWAVGTGGMLIRRSVLERIKEWQGHDRVFENSEGEIINEDTEFCRKLRAIGVEMYVDCSVRMGHCGMFVVWPREHEGKWGVQFQMGEGQDGMLQGIFLQPGEKPPDGS